MATVPTAPDRTAGRGLLWAGIAACVLGVALVFVQFGLKRLFAPWYSPALATLGALLLLIAVARGPGVVRVIVLLLVAAFAGLQWYFFVFMLKLPEYQGPVQAGKYLPTFTATLADGKEFTDSDLRDGRRTVLVFFRGRW